MVKSRWNSWNFGREAPNVGMRLYHLMVAGSVASKVGSNKDKLFNSVGFSRVVVVGDSHFRNIFFIETFHAILYISVKPFRSMTNTF